MSWAGLLQPPQPVMWRSSDSTSSSLQTKGSSFLLLVFMTSFFHSLPTAHDHEWGFDTQVDWYVDTFRLQSLQHKDQINVSIILNAAPIHLGFLPPSKNMHVGLTDDSELPCDGLATCPGAPCLWANDSWDGLQPPATLSWIKRKWERQLWSHDTYLRAVVKESSLSFGSSFGLHQLVSSSWMKTTSYSGKRWAQSVDGCPGPVAGWIWMIRHPAEALWYCRSVFGGLPSLSTCSSSSSCFFCGNVESAAVFTLTLKSETEAVIRSRQDVRRPASVLAHEKYSLVLSYLWRSGSLQSDLYLKSWWYTFSCSRSTYWLNWPSVLGEISVYFHVSVDLHSLMGTLHLPPYLSLSQGQHLIFCYIKLLYKQLTGGIGWMRRGRGRGEEEEDTEGCEREEKWSSFCSNLVSLWLTEPKTWILYSNCVLSPKTVTENLIKHSAL